MFNRGAFLKRFGGFQSLHKLKEIPEYLQDQNLFPPEFTTLVQQVKSGEKLTWHEFERALVREYKCNPQNSLCIYDFTQRFTVPDYFCLSVPDLTEFLIRDYYGDTLEYRDLPDEVPVYRGIHLCEDLELRTAFADLFETEPKKA